MSTPDTAAPPSTIAEVQALLQARTAQFVEATAVVDRIYALTASGLEVPPGTRTPDRLQVLRALAEKPDAEMRYRLLAAEVEDLSRVLERLRGEQFEKDKAAANAARKPGVVKLAHTLRVARQANNEVAEEETELRERFLEAPAAFRALFEELDLWEREMQVRGLLPKA